MDTQLNAKLTHTCRGEPLAEVDNLPGAGAELTPRELRALAAALVAIAADCEGRPVLEVYAKQAQNVEAERRASEIRLRAERRTGELLKELARATPQDSGSISNGGLGRSSNRVTTGLDVKHSGRDMPSPTLMRSRPRASADRPPTATRRAKETGASAALMHSGARRCSNIAGP